ncbi:hypothetical protein ACQEU8_18535 [Streptomyces sp. CA-250714]|uniref:hypothetical protein n=1 Tax=Streptomyces sp. CA-250714 TaxID=3240060 RepID=UPI003D8B4D9A
MYQPQQRTSRLRVVTLASAVALVGALPLAAAVSGQDARLASKAFEAAQPPARTDSDDTAPKAHPSDVRPSKRDRPAVSCGPEIASPEGVAARACVLTDDGDTWARAYYRNPTDRRLPAVLTLRGPDGRTARVHCTLRGGGAPDVCETPRGRGGKAAAAAEGAYAAVVEVVSADGERLLRADSGSRPFGGNSRQRGGS